MTYPNLGINHTPVGVISKHERLQGECFVNRILLFQGGMILHAQLEIWKAAYSDDDICMNWRPETTPSTASSEDVSDGEHFIC